MCKPCGCVEVIEKGKAAIIERVAELVKELRVNSSNVDDFECVEVMSGMIAPLSSKHADIFEVAAWIEKLHEGMTHYESRSQKYALAYEDVLARRPVQGEPKKIAGMYHQLEQLVNKLDGTDIVALEKDPEVLDGVNAVMNVHKDRTRAGRLKERYNL
jgi:hypothetical protein